LQNKRIAIVECTCSITVIHLHSVSIQELEQKLVEKLKTRHEKERELKESLPKWITGQHLPPIKRHKLMYDEIPVVFGASA